MWSLCNAGMHAWFAAFADTRYSVVVPIIGVQVCLIKCFEIYEDYQLSFQHLSLKWH